MSSHQSQSITPEQRQTKLTAAIQTLASESSEAAAAGTRKVYDVLREARVVECKSDKGESSAVVSLPYAASATASDAKAADPKEAKEKDQQATSAIQLRIVWTHGTAGRGEVNELTITDISSGGESKEGKVLFADQAKHRNVYRGESVYFVTIDQSVNELTEWLTARGVTDCDQPDEPEWSEYPPVTSESEKSG